MYCADYKKGQLYISYRVTNSTVLSWYLSGHLSFARGVQGKREGEGGDESVR